MSGLDACEVLTHAVEAREPAVLATIIGVEGHSYRSVGAMMLFLQSGGTIGSISPGCLESDLQERIDYVLSSGEAKIVRYDMRPDEDAIWGEALGCGGVIWVLLEPVSAPLLRALRSVRRLLEAGEGAALLRFKAEQGFRYEWAPVSDEPLSRARNEQDEPFYVNRFVPRSRLIVFGAGQDADSICELAGRIGFRLAVADWRPSLCTAQRYPGAELAVGTARAIAEQLSISSRDYVVICSHQLRKDREMLEVLLPLRPAYIGIMGSKSRIRHLTEGLPIPGTVSAPVGLDIGAEGSQEIAVSIAAELIAIRKRRHEEERGTAFEGSGNIARCGREFANGKAQAFFGTGAR